MSHIDEGALHAYLDGALEAYSATEAEQVRQHLDRCPECQERLEEERTVRARAQSILALAAPEADLSPLEELRARARARTPGPTRVRSRSFRIGWAASVVLALGAGWLLRGGGDEVSSATLVRAESGAERSRQESGASGSDGGTPAVPAVALSQGAARAPSEAAGGRAEVVGDLAEVVGDNEVDRAAPGDAGAVESLAVADAGAAADDLLPSRTQLARLSGAGRVEAPGDVEPLVARVARAESEPAAEPTESTEPLGDDPGRAGTVVVDRGRAPPPLVTSASRVGAIAGLSPLGTTVSRRSGSASEPPGDTELYSLVVPGIEVLQVSFRGGVRPEGQVVLQRLESGDTLSVVHLPAGIDPSTIEAPQASERQVVVQRASGSIVMRAPVPEDELLDLMERLLGAP